MKIIFTQFFILFFVSCSFFAEAQIFDYVFRGENYYAKPYAVEADGNGGWFVGGAEFFDIYRQTDYLLHLDGQGNLLWKKNFILGERVETKKITTLSNGDLFISGSRGLCDVSPWGFGFRINSNGDSLWYVENDFEHNTAVSEHDNGKLNVLTFFGNIIQINANGTNGTSQNLNSNKRYSEIADLSGNNSVVISGYNNLVLLNSVNDSIGYQSFSQLPLGLKTHQDIVSFFVGKLIYRFDAQLNPIDTQNFTGHFNQIIDYETRSDGYQIIGYYQNQSFLKMFDNNGNLTQSIALGTLKTIPTAIRRQGQYVAVIGTESAPSILVSPYYNGTPFDILTSENTFVKTFSVDVPNQNEINDVEILEVMTSSVHKQPFNCMVTNVEQKKINWKGLQVLVKNNSDSTLNNFILHTKNIQWCSYGCGTDWMGYYSDTIQNLNLASGDSAWVNFQDVQYIGQQDVNEHKICFWATVPNFKMDDNLDNNLACLTMIATNSNEVLTQQTHHIFPNPTDGFMNIEFENPTKIETIKLINQIGQIVDNQIINKEISNYKMDISHLPKGIYFMEIWTENGRQIGKVIRN